MPELPDVTVYLEALHARAVGRVLARLRVGSPFVLRTFEPGAEAFVGRRVRGVCRLGKRIVLEFDDALYAVIHLMIAGRLRWLPPGGKPLGKIELARFEFGGESAGPPCSSTIPPARSKTALPAGPASSDPHGDGILVLTEAGTRKRASLHLVRGEAELARLDPGGLEVLDATAETFAAVLRRENHTLKRALTDPRLFSGIGNAYSDEILHAARLSPVALTARLSDEEAARLHAASRNTLLAWTQRLREQFAGRFPGAGEITAFRPDFAVHGRFGRPCPVCETAVQRIRYAENETNYCPTCQTAGRVLADRSLSRLLRDDWPRTVEDGRIGLTGEREASLPADGLLTPRPSIMPSATPRPGRDMQTPVHRPHDGQGRTNDGWRRSETDALH